MAETQAGSSTSNCSIEGLYVTVIWPIDVRLASNTGSVGLRSASSLAASSAAPDPVCSRVRIWGSSRVI
jgi:hypothetical protein